MNLIPVDAAHGAVLAMLTGSTVQELVDQGVGTIGARPEDIELKPGGDAQVQLVERLGAESLVHLTVAPLDETVTVLTADRRLEFGQMLRLRIPLDKIHRFDARGQRCTSR
jgi:multiple sugar transport system ATP-binding protein